MVAASFLAGKITTTFGGFWVSLDLATEDLLPITITPERYYSIVKIYYFSLFKCALFLKGEMYILIWHKKCNAKEGHAL